MNADGLTYGVANERGTPDLVAAIASNGKVGYVYSRDMFPPTPTSLQMGGTPSLGPSWSTHQTATRSSGSR